jgi:hypothetical protein
MFPNPNCQGDPEVVPFTFKAGHGLQVLQLDRAFSSARLLPGSDYGVFGCYVFHPCSFGATPLPIGQCENAPAGQMIDKIEALT